MIRRLACHVIRQHQFTSLSKTESVIPSYLLSRLVSNVSVSSYCRLLQCVVTESIVLLAATNLWDITFTCPKTCRQGAIWASTHCCSYATYDTFPKRLVKTSCVLRGRRLAKIKRREALAPPNTGPVHNGLLPRIACPHATTATKSPETEHRPLCAV